MVNPSIASIVHTINRIKTISYWFVLFFTLIRSLILAAMTIALWHLIRPDDELVQIGLGVWTLFLSLIFPVEKLPKKSVEAKNLVLKLEMTEGAEQKTPLNSELQYVPLPEEWIGSFENQKKAVLAFELKKQCGLISSLIVPLFITTVALSQGIPSFKTAIKEVSSVVSRLSRGASLRIISGTTSKRDGELQTYDLTTEKPHRIELLAENLIEIQVVDGSLDNEPPVVILKKLPSPLPSSEGAPNASKESSNSTPQPPAEDEIYQSFQLLPIQDATDQGEALGSYRLAFAVNESVGLFVPSFAGEKQLASLIVRQPPVPKVNLEVIGQVEEPWPDDQPLPLRIQVKAENPLQNVHLIIKSGSRTSKELVANVMAENKTSLASEYRLVLETYVESDLAQVEIIAEATDRAVPLPLIGYSNSLKLNTASSYGRYRETLKTLRNLKGQIDEALNKGEIKLPNESLKMANKATLQSEKSPFFDGLDRMQIYRFAASVKDNRESPSTESLLEVSGLLNDFLFEHEILDDRERDRDFFVAMRNISRLIEQDQNKRSVTVSTVTERTRKFLDDRYQRWIKRIERLGITNVPERWETVKDKKPFHQAMFNIDKLDKSTQSGAERTADMLTILSKSAVEYRAWIEELEAREDKVREAEEKARQEGLANARDVLRELQQRQGEVSQGLDRSNERPRGQIASEWPTLRMKQNTNSRDTKRLESQIRALSPSAAARIEAAYGAMNETMNAGDTENFEVAETGSDLAGRLLRQAESAAQDSQQKRSNRGRRRRVTGDSYYGQSVVGGDVEIKREYQVDKKYREDILNEVQNSEYDEENRTLLERYLRHVVR